MAMAGRTYRRDANGRFASNGNTSAGKRKALQRQTGARRTANGRDATNPRRIYSRAGNSHSIKGTIAGSQYLRQKDQFAREMRATPLRSGKPRPPRPNRFVKGRKVGRIAEDNMAFRPQRVGTVSRSSARRQSQAELRGELKLGKQSMTSFRKEFRSGRRYIRR